MYDLTVHITILLFSGHVHSHIKLDAGRQTDRLTHTKQAKTLILPLSGLVAGLVSVLLKSCLVLVLIFIHND